MKTLYAPLLKETRNSKKQTQDIYKNTRVEFLRDLIAIKRNRHDRDGEEGKLFLALGMVISLILIIGMFEFQTKQIAPGIELTDMSDALETIAEIPTTSQPPPPPPKIIPERITEVDNSEDIIEIEVNLDVEMHEETIVEDVIYEIPDLPMEEEKIEEIFDIVETYPQPVGGFEGFYTFLAENIRYPSKAQRLGVSGRVFLQFVVEKDGSLTDVRVIKGIGSGCDEEAIRVIKSAPKWTPGKQRGRLVRVRQSIPIFFNLE